jgi:AraC-like DNA-binding protein
MAAQSGNADGVRAALDQVRLTGAVFLRAEYREPWAYESLTGPETAAFLVPGEDSMAFFHLVARGRCWVEVDDQRHWADAGDVVVLPYGHQHRMGGAEPTQPVSVTSFIPPPPWPRMPVIRYGAQGSRTDVVCGYLLSDDILFDPLLRVFPPVFVVRPPEGPVADWVRANIEYAAQQTSIDVPARAETGVSTRLPELMLIEVLKIHLATAPSSPGGLVAALRDPVLGRALAMVHADPGRKWTVVDLASAVHVSRSLLDERFRTVLGIAPMQYVTTWRMHRAKDLLQGTTSSVAAVAHQVGYDAEEAFSRAFKRECGTPPGVWRLRSHGT